MPIDPQLEQHFKEDLAFQARFDHHLEIYARNGKELARLANAVDNLTKTINSHIEQTKPMMQWFEGMSFMKKAFMWILGLFASIGGLILLIRELWK